MGILFGTKALKEKLIMHGYPDSFKLYTREGFDREKSSE